MINVTLILFTLVLLSIATAFVVNENGICAFIIIVIAGLVIDKWFAPFLRDIGNWIADNTLLFIVSIVGYIVIGIIWSCFKWFWFLRGEKRPRHYETGSLTMTYRFDLMRWVGYWPLSLTWDIAQWPLTKVWKHVYHLMLNTYKRIEAKALPSE